MAQAKQCRPMHVEFAKGLVDVLHPFGVCGGTAKSWGPAAAAWLAIALAKGGYTSQQCTLHNRVLVSKGRYRSRAKNILGPEDSALSGLGVFSKPLNARMNAFGRALALLLTSSG